MGLQVGSIWGGEGPLSKRDRETERYTETETEKLPEKTKLLLYTFLFLEEAPSLTNPTKEFRAMVKMMGH